MQKIVKSIGHAGTYIFLIVLLSSCGSNPPITSTSGQGEDIEVSLENITQLLDNADQQSDDERAFIYMNVTQALLDANEIDWARNTLAQLYENKVPSDQYIRYSVLAATIAIAQGNAGLAKRVLWQARLNNIAAQAADEEKIKLHEIRAQLLRSLAEYRASIKERIALHLLLEEGSEESQDNQDQLWQTLMELPFTDLKLESQIQSEMLAKGWYTLARLSKDNQTNLRNQISAVESWMLNWPEHPASLRLPGDLQLLQQLENDQPGQIAILLPFSGRFEAVSAAIRDGIMAAYYEAANQSNILPDLRVYDTTSADINEIYDEATLQGAELIIGPLEQSKIAQLAQREALPIPTLALNRLAENNEMIEGLFQFGLPLEDEVEQVAEQAWRDGHRRAMILSSRTSNGDRSVKSFSERWLELGGEIINDYRYNSQSGYSNLIKNAVKVQDSENRKKQVRSIIGKSINFEPRRRKDIDFIFLYSQASQARQLKPTLAFHYAGGIPVYAIKDIFNGQNDPKRDKDLNQIRFTTLPWFFDSESPEKKAITQSSQSTNYQFFYALGVDAYHIHPRLRQLKLIKQAHFYGTTGKLRLDEQQRIKREQVWAQFVKGIATPMVTFSPEDDF
ncbi:penicillin-binding protein activator [Agarilytica rhodophyticola]|uniref:penicillin-binding protein activator n=1 Tax=Agarilytica rhodophyticola TaxID=1737490 RepID=UPI000B349E19|nr:penicillin-binding protein activator [Agarilytica rhodophyticola]